MSVRTQSWGLCALLVSAGLASRASAINQVDFPNIAPPQCEGIPIIPANEQFVGVDYLGDSILYADQSNFAPFAGDILVVSEVLTPGTSGLSRLLWSGGAGGSFGVVPIPLAGGSIAPQLWEGSNFAPVVVPAPSIAVVVAFGLGIAATRRRR